MKAVTTRLLVFGDSAGRKHCRCQGHPTETRFLGRGLACAEAELERWKEGLAAAQMTRAATKCALR